MNCKEVLALQTEYIDGELPENEAQKIRSHLKTCQSCRQEFVAMENLLHTLHNLDDIAVPENLADEVIAAVKRGPETEKRVFVLPRFLRSWQTYSVAAACILLFTAVSTDINHRAALTNTAYIYTTESATPRAVEIPAAFVDNATTDETVPPSATISPAPVPTTDVPVPFANATEPEVIPAPAAEMSPDFVYNTPPAMAEESAPTPEAQAASGGTMILSPKAATSENTRYMLSDNAQETHDASTSDSSVKELSKSAPAPKTYSTVGSLVKRRVTFVVDDADAQAVFNNSKSGGVTSVKNALYRAGIDFSTRESVIEELAPEYNALVQEANSLSARIAAGNTSLRSQLSKKEAEMQALKDSCKNPSLSLSFE